MEIGENAYERKRRKRDELSCCWNWIFIGITILNGVYIYIYIAADFASLSKSSRMQMIENRTIGHGIFEGKNK